ncbi:MAG: HEPN family nuclease [Planctomycetota bacterium]|jgi:hypothetical protein
MVYARDFKHSYMGRTLELVDGYRGPHEATHLINSLIGLLVVPNDTVYRVIPDTPLSQLRDWGISRGSIKRFSNGRKGNGKPPTLLQIIRRLRRSVAQFRAKPRYANGRFTGVEFRDGRSFHVVLTTGELRRFVQKLAQTVGGYCDLDDPEIRYIASWQRDPFHKASCKWARRISRKNLQGVKSRGAAVKAGHRPCRVCKP